MAWFTRFTRFGDTHAVYAQEEDNSCGIACVMMTVFKINKIVPGKKALHVEKKIYDVYSEVSGSTYDGTGYSFCTELAKTLNKLNVGTWEGRNIGSNNVSQAIIDSTGIDAAGVALVQAAVNPAAYVVNQLRTRTPIIVLVDWNKGGAHFVVVDQVNQMPTGTLYASVCDPWDGDVHVTEFQRNAAFTYHGAPVPLSWDLGGRKHNYDTPQTGSPGGWVVRKIG